MWPRTGAVPRYAAATVVPRALIAPGVMAGCDNFEEAGSCPARSTVAEAPMVCSLKSAALKERNNNDRS